MHPRAAPHCYLCSFGGLVYNSRSDWTPLSAASISARRRDVILLSALSAASEAAQITKILHALSISRFLAVLAAA